MLIAEVRVGHGAVELAVVEPQRLQSGVVERVEVMRGNLSALGPHKVPVFKEAPLAQDPTHQRVCTLT